MRKQNADLDTIAQRLGVSKTTVHYALQNTGRVSMPVRKRVLALARELDYRPNLLARSLRSQRTGTIGVIAVGLSSTFFSNVIEGIENAARLHELSMLLSCSYFDAQKERDAIHLLLDKGVDGLIVAPADPRVNTPLYEQLIAERTPIVFIDRRIQGVGINSVTTDNMTGGQLAGEHLARLGRKRCAMVLPSLQAPFSTSVQDRIEGFNRALHKAGIDDALLIGPPAPDNRAEAAYLATARFLEERGVCVDAIFATNDGLAIGAMRALHERGVRVPDDVAVVGFDDHQTSAFIQPALTTVRQPMREIGAEAIQSLLRRMQEPEAACQQVLLEPALIVRESCGAKRLLK